VLLFVTILDGMLLPNERVSSYGEKFIEVLGSKRSEFEGFSFQNGLEIEGHTEMIVG
jgi:hypothetical protein